MSDTPAKWWSVGNHFHFTYNAQNYTDYRTLSKQIFRPVIWICFLLMLKYMINSKILWSIKKANIIFEHWIQTVIRAKYSYFSFALQCGAQFL